MFLTIFLFLFLIFIVIILFVMTSSLLGFLITRVPYVPTSENDIRFVAEKLNITSADVFYDLGSGNGQVVFLVNALTGAKCVGYELTWWTYWWSKIRLKIWDLRFKKTHSIEF